MMRRVGIIAAIALVGCGKVKIWEKKSRNDDQPAPTQTSSNGNTPDPQPIPTTPAASGGSSNTPVPSSAKPNPSSSIPSLPVIPGAKTIQLLDNGVAIPIATKDVSAFSDAEALELNNTASKFKSLDLSPAANSLFTNFFANVDGTTPIQKIGNYLQARMHYLIKNTEVTASGVVGSNLTALSLTTLYNKYVDQKQLSGAKYEIPSENFDGISIPYNRPDIGIIKITSDFFSPSYATTMDRIQTFIHESRHSDCSAAPSASVVQSFLASQTSQTIVCFHSHEKCPTGHDLAGQYACDSSPWGSYTVSYLFEDLIVNNCKSCTAQEKMHALAEAIDMKTRVLLLNDLLSGKAGTPDLTLLKSF